MPQVIYTRRALEDLQRFRDFLDGRSPEAAHKAIDAIQHQLRLLETFPEVGRPVSGLANIRELIIDFGATGYIARYRYARGDVQVIVLALRHQREAGWGG